MPNPFLTLDGCVDRLVREYKKHGKLIICVDFDDTLFNFHSGDYTLEQNEIDHKQVLDLLRECKRRGFYVTIFTASVPTRWERMRKYCSDMGIEVDSINKNAIELPYGNHGKIYYNILLDDRAGLYAAVETLQKFFEVIVD